MMIMYYHPKHKLTAERTYVLARVHGYNLIGEESKSEKAYSISLSKNATRREKKASEALTMFANGLELLALGNKASCWKKYNQMWGSKRK